MVDGVWAPANVCNLKLTLIIFPPGFQSGWCQKKGNYRIDHFWLWKKEEKSHHHSTFLPFGSPPPSLRTRPGSFDKRYRTLEWRWRSLVSCAAFTLSHQRGSTRLSFLFWFNLPLLSSDFFGGKIFFSWQERRNSGWVGGTPWGRGRIIIGLMTTLTITNQQLHN